jgi:protein gp37
MNDGKLMNIPEVYQVVIDPREEVSDTLMKRIEKLAHNMPDFSLMVKAKLWFGMAVHPLGVHTLVRHMRYDPNSDRLIQVGRVCMYCSKGLSR